jgi:cell division protein FtsB
MINQRTRSKTSIEQNKLKYDSLLVDISGKQAEYDNLQNEVSALEEKRGQYIQDKILLQSDKEELANRELFIMNKYEQAGVAYKNEPLKTTKDSIAERAELDQMKKDLDKRELFIREKYQKAGLDYL